MALSRRTVLAGLLLSGAPRVVDSRAVAQPAPPIIAAASDLQFALEETATLFRAQTGHSVRLILGSSGNFARQIRQRAPFDMYLSADEQYVIDLAKDGFTQDEGTNYGIGRVVLFVPHGSALKPDGTLDDLQAALADGRLTKFAIANPEHAPYGKRAEEALRHRGIWDRIKDKLVFGENVSQAAHYSASSATQGGIIAYSLALGPKMTAVGQFGMIPAHWHQTMRQRMVLLKHAAPVARSFYAFVQTPAARAIFVRYGFALSGE